MKITHPNQVWCADITYIPMAHGFMYLVVIMDWYSRYVLAWRLSNTLDADFCVEALEEALSKGKPDIFKSHFPIINDSISVETHLVVEIRASFGLILFWKLSCPMRSIDN